MALTAFQKEVLGVISKNRNPNSHFAGGATLNKDAPRISQDLDIFNDSHEVLVVSVQTDIESLQRRGFDVELDRPFAPPASHAEAVVSKGEGFTRLDWSIDSVFRFFPAIVDQEFGWRLHPFDLATNKILALAGRREPRDYVDIVEIDRTTFSIAALAWAAPGKDPGFTPLLVLDEINRNARYTTQDLQLVSSLKSLDLVDLKTRFLSSIAHARDIFPSLPLDTVGSAFIGPDGAVLRPSAEVAFDPKVIRHTASPYGSLPQVSDQQS